MVRTSRPTVGICTFAALSIAAAVTPSLVAAAPAQTDYAPAPSAPSDGEWEGAISPYVWFAGLNADVGGRERLPSVKVDTSFGDIARSLKFGAMFMGQARRDRFVAIGDVMYVSVGNSRDLRIRDPSLVSVSLKVKQFTSTLAAGYRVIDQGPVFFDLLGGLRITDLKEDFRLSGPNRSFTGSSSRTLVDPIIGARTGGRLGGRWSYTVYGDVGGFGASSDLTWQVMGLVNYRISRQWTASAGWRHLAYDASNNSFEFDGSLDGPIIGVSYRF